MLPPMTRMTTYGGEFLYKDETFAVIGICMAVHRTLGHGFFEIVYKNAIEFELKKKNLPSDREKEYKIGYKGIILPHKFYADFVVDEKIILEVKAAEGGIAETQIAQCLNYLKVSGCKIGLIVNFGRSSLAFKRLIF